MWSLSLAQRRFQSFCTQQNPRGIYFPLLPRAMLPLAEVPQAGTRVALKSASLRG